MDTGQFEVPMSSEVDRMVLDALCDIGIIVLSRNGTLVSYNASAERLLRLSRDDIGQMTIQRLMSDARQEDGTPFPSDDEPVSITLRTGQPSVDVTMGLQLEQGRMIWISLHSRPLLGQAGNQHGGVVCSFTDITSRKNEIDKLRATNQLLQAVADGTNDAMYVKDSSGNYLYINNAGAAIARQPLDAILGRDDRFLFETETAQRLMGVDRTVMQSGNVSTAMETVLIDGATRYFLSTKAPYRNSTGHIIGVIGVSRDITERVCAERTLRDSEDRYHFLMDSLPAYISYVDSQERYRYVNQRYEQWYQRPRHEIVGRSVLELQGPSNYSAMQTNVHRALQGESIRYEHCLVGQGTASRIFDTRYIPHIHPSGEVLGFLVMVFDVTEDRQREATVRANEEKYRALFETCGDAILILNTQGHICAANPAAAQMHGHTVDELLQLRIQDLDVPEDAQRIAERMHNLRDGQTLHFEVTHRRKCGTTFPVEVVATPLVLGEELFILAIDRDITERKQSERSLRLTQFSIDRAVDSIFWIGPTGNIFYVNDAACRTLGYRREELVGKTVPEIDPNFPAHAWHDHWEDLKRRRSFTFESEHLTKDGRTIQTEVTVNYLQYEGQEYNCALMRDITARKKTEEERDRLWNHSPDPLCVAGFDGWLKQVNPTWSRILGWSDEELLGTPWIHFIHPEDRAASVQAHQRLLQGTPVQGFENRYRCKDGRYRWFSWNSIPSHATHTIYGFVRDVTEHKQLEEQFRQSQKMEAVGRLAGGVAHDFNNLLTVINGYAEFLLTAPACANSLREPLTAILRAGERAAGLTEQLLAFSRKAIIEPQIIDFNRLITAMVSLLRRLIGENISLTTLLDPNLHRIKADRSQLEQVIMNLVVNARDAMPAGGNITVGTRNVELDSIDCRSDSELVPGRYVELTVTDTGQGISEAFRNKIFEPFFTTKPLGQGTGLGLSVAHGVAKQCGGTIRVQSEVGVGTTFFLILPQVAQENDPAFPQGDSPALRGTEKILLVEDEVAVRGIARMMLESQGYQVLEASCGVEAMQLARQHANSIDLLLTDVVMPDISGRQLVDAIRLIQPHLRVLFVSGYMDDSIMRHGIETSQDMFLQKPFSRSSLALGVRQAIDLQ